MLYEERVARGYYAEQRRYGAVFAYKSTVGTLATKCNRLAKRYVQVYKFRPAWNLKESSSLDSTTAPPILQPSRACLQSCAEIQRNDRRVQWAVNKTRLIIFQRQTPV